MVDNYPIPHSFPWLSEKIQASLDILLNSHQFASGETNKIFKIKLAEYLQIQPNNLLLAPSGTHALFYALKLLGIHANASIIMPTFACPDLATAVSLANGHPVVLDINQHLALDPKSIELYLEQHDLPSAMIVVHPFGQILDITPYKQWGIPIIEDFAHCFTPFENKVRGDLGIFSFQATKWLPIGEAGALAIFSTDKIKIALNEAQTLLPSKLSDLIAAIGICQLEKLPESVQKRKDLFDSYQLKLAQQLKNLTPFKYRDKTIPFRFIVGLKGSKNNINSLKSLMYEQGICIRRPVEPMIHQYLSLDENNFPVANQMYDNLISLPFYPDLTESQIAFISKTLIAAIEELST
jgi:UDP-4-amino-4-deoxy-L-arabinose-oxoglutarate aminotransferase